MTEQMFRFLDRCLELGLPMIRAPHYLAVEFDLSYFDALDIYRDWVLTRPNRRLRQ